MKKKNYFKTYGHYRIYKKFYNLQKRIRGLMQNGEYYRLTTGIQTRLMRKLNLLFERISRIISKQTLKWASAAVALIISGNVASAQFNEPVNLSGFKTNFDANSCFVDFDKDGDQDIVIGDNEGSLTYINNIDNKFNAVNGATSPFYNISVDSLAAPALADVDNDNDLDLVVGSLDGTLAYYKNIDSVYTLTTGGDNPFDGINVGYSSNPFFIDFDKDDDQDLIVGEAGGAIKYFKNNAGTFTELTGIDNPFDGVEVDFGAYPRMADYDKDGDLDLYVGNKYGELNYYKNNAGSFVIQTGSNNPFNAVVIDSVAIPTLVNLDDDGDWDLAVGDRDSGHLRYFRNDGGVYSEKRGTANPFEGVLSNITISPAFADLDDDGDLDLVVSDLYGAVFFYENTDEGFIPVTGSNNPLEGIVFGYGPKLEFSDVDGDEDIDMIVGNDSGKIKYFANEGGDFFEMTGDDNPFDAISLGNYITPVLVDLDDDNDNDLVVGKFVENGDNDFGEIAYYRNVNNNFFEQNGSDNPFSELFTTDSIKSPLNPAFADLDFDGDFDLYLGNKYGNKIETFINNEGVFTKAVGDDNPFGEYDFSSGFSPAFADTDKDGDEDFYIGAFDKYGGGKLYFVENTSGPSAVNNYTDTMKDILVYSHNKIITIDAGEHNIDMVEIYSVSGTLVVSGKLQTNGKIELPVNNLNTGIYFVKTYSDGKSENHKVLIH